MRWHEVNNTYVKQAQLRIARALERSTKIPVRIWPAPVEQEVAGQSFWAVLAVLMRISKSSSDQNTQVWRVYCELVYKPHIQQYDPTIYSEVSTIFAQAYNYLFAHHRLRFEDTDESVPYLRSDAVDVQMNAMNSSGQPGASIFVELPFHVNIEQER